MRLILIGCEYAGKTTLVNEIAGWIERTMGPPIPQGMPPFHDHFTFPQISHGELSDQECAQVTALSPQLKAMIQNHQIAYHLNPAFYRDHDNILVGFHIEDAVYGPLYYGYEEDGSRTAFARKVESEIMEKAPDTVLVLLKASPQVIARRMRENPHAWGVLKEEKIEYVLNRFQEEYADSVLRYRFTLDTSAAKVEETLGQFVDYIRPHLTESDRTRLLAHLALDKRD